MVVLVQRQALALVKVVVVFADRTDVVGLQETAVHADLMAAVDPPLVVHVDLKAAEINSCNAVQVVVKQNMDQQALSWALQPAPSAVRIN